MARRLARCVEELLIRVTKCYHRNKLLALIRYCSVQHLLYQMHHKVNLIFIHRESECSI